MFLLVIVSPIAKSYNWKAMEELVHSQLPYHESTMINIQNKQVPLNYTIKRNERGIEMIAASTISHGVKSRFIYDCTKKIGCIDFPRKNLRAWIIKNGSIVVRPIMKRKEFKPSDILGFSKLAALHLESYLKHFANEIL